MNQHCLVFGKIGDSPIGEVYDCCDTQLQQKRSVIQIDANLCKENYETNWEALSKTFRFRHPYYESVVDSEKAAARIYLPERGCSLGTLIRESQSRLQQRAVRAVIYDILNLLIYFRKQGFVHGDIRPETLLLPTVGDTKETSSPKILLAYSPGVYFGGEILLFRRDRKYLAPEMLKPKYGSVSSATDMYLLAFTALELLFGEYFNSLYNRIGPDGKPHFTFLNSSQGEQLPPLRKVFPEIDDDLYYFFHTVLHRKVAYRPASPKELLFQMKNRYILHRITRFLIPKSSQMPKGTLHHFNEYFHKLDLVESMKKERGTRNLPDKDRAAYLLEKVVPFLRGFAVPDEIIDELHQTDLTFDQPKHYGLTISGGEISERIAPVTQWQGIAEQGDNPRSETTTSKGEIISDLSGKAKKVQVEEDPEVWDALKDFVQNIPSTLSSHKPREVNEPEPAFSWTNRQWWDAQFKKKPVLYGLFGGILVIFVILLILSSMNETSPYVPLPDTCSIVEQGGWDKETQLPCLIEFRALKETEPLRLVLVKPVPNNRIGAEEDDCRIGELDRRKLDSPPFYIAEREVSLQQFSQILRREPSEESKGDAQTTIPHEDAKEFCRLLQGKLPTEDQWEYAATYGGESPSENRLGSTLQWCDEKYRSGFGEEKLPISEDDFLVKGRSSESLSNEEGRPTWRAPAPAKGAVDISFRPVILPKLP